MEEQVMLQGRAVGGTAPILIIAEAGVNHNGDMVLAHKLIDAAVGAGADAVKFQSFIAEDLVTARSSKAAYQVATTGTAGAQYDMLKALELSPGQQAELKRHCDQAGIMYLCTPYERKSIDMLDRLDIAAYKIASTDTSNIPLLRYVAQKQRPVILSTGMSTLGEVDAAVMALRENGLNRKLILLHCTSEYPAPVHEANLRAMHTLQLAFNCPVGFSDHTPGIGLSPWAAVLGACILEKHFSLDRNMKGPDHRASIEPGELALLVKTVRDVVAALGNGIKRPMPSEIVNKPYMQKSLVAAQTIRAGAFIREEDLTCKRPGTGMAPALIDKVVGRRAAKDLQADDQLSFASIRWETD